MKLETGKWNREAGAFVSASRLHRHFGFGLQPLACPSARCGGFTLMELLLVMVVIAILGTIIMGSATYITRLSRQRRAQVSCRVLESALARYRSDYNKWPIGTLNPKATGTAGKLMVTVTGKDNSQIFGALRENSGQNERGIRYLDETTLYTLDSKDKPIALVKAGTGAKPLVYVPREGGGFKYFRVDINVDDDTAEVSTPELGN